MISALVGNELVSRSDVLLGEKVILKANVPLTIDRVMYSEKVPSGLLIGLKDHDLMFDSNVTYLEDRFPLSPEAILKFNN